MDGVYEIIPGSVPAEFAGRTWSLGPWTLADDAEVERRILAKRRRPLKVAREMIAGQPEHLQRHILALAYADECAGFRATRRELSDWLETREGQLVEFWLRARKNHKELTLEDVERSFSAEAAASAKARAPELSGESPLGNSPSPAMPGSAIDQSPGERFSAGSSQLESAQPMSAT